MVAQVTSRVSDELEAALNRWAAEEGRQRSDLIREILAEGLAAHQQGRTMYDRREKLSPADLQRLIGELQALRMEIDRVLRQGAERDAALAKSARDDTIGISEARTAIVSQVAIAIDRQLQTLLGVLVALSEKIDNPPSVTAMHDDIRALWAEIGDNRAADLAAAKENQAQIIRETRKRRSLFTFAVTDKSWSSTFLMTWSLGLATFGALCLFLLASFFPAVAMPIAAKLLRHDDEICQLVDRRYDVTDCTTPNMRHKAEEEDTINALAPPVTRRKRR